MIEALRKELTMHADPEKAKNLSRFFKTKEGEYGHGDVFIGLKVPESRKIASKYKYLSFSEIKLLLHAKVHEERLIGLLILVYKFSTGSDADREKIFRFYLQHTAGVNNWDLVDLSADKIVGAYVYTHVHERNILYTLAVSKNIWERRISIIATYYFITHGECDDTVKIAEILLHDTHDLIQKAVGWMLREVGKRCSQEKEEAFLNKHYKTMPRTMLRYAIERFPEEKRKRYLNGTI